MTTMNISLPDSLKNFIDEQVNERGFGSSSEYIRELVRKDQERAHLRNLLLVGVESTPSIEANQDYFEKLRKRIKSDASES